MGIYDYQNEDSWRNGDISQRSIDDIENFVIKGIPPSGVIHAILQNDLKAACNFIHSGERKNLFAITNWVYSNVPAMAYETTQAIYDWCDDKNKRRTSYIKKMEQNAIMDALTSE